MSSLQKTIGIVRENRSVWDRRVPLTPKDVQTLKKLNPSLNFIIQPSKIRIFKNTEYEQVGAIISEDLSSCDLILGVREQPIETLIPNTTYMFFGHLIKAQSKNMKLLDALVEKNIRFIDYEKITDENNKRLVYFGRFGGMAAAIDFLAGLGSVFLKRGISTPLLTISFSYKYFSLEHAKKNLTKVSQLLQYGGIPKGVSPLVFAITGKGRTSSGVYEILKLMPIKEIKPEDLPKIFESRDDPIHTQHIYLCFIEHKHMVERIDKSEFNKADYYNHPNKYQPIFHTKYLPYISVIFNCIYWDQRFPRLIEDDQIKELCLEGKSRLLGVCDVTCDIEGSIEFLKRYTNEDMHFYTYDPINKKVIDDIEIIDNGILYQAIDAISTELSYDASAEFGSCLIPFIEKTAFSDLNKSLNNNEQNLQDEIFRAVVTWNGKLTQGFQYIDSLRKASESIKVVSKKIYRDNNVISIDLFGHLFDSLAINDIAKLVKDESDIKIDLVPINIGRNNDEKTKANLIISCPLAEKRKKVFEDIEIICSNKNIDIIIN